MGPCPSSRSVKDEDGSVQHVQAPCWHGRDSRPQRRPFKCIFDGCQVHGTPERPFALASAETCSTDLPSQRSLIVARLDARAMPRRSVGASPLAVRCAGAKVASLNLLRRPVRRRQRAPSHHLGESALLSRSARRCSLKIARFSGVRILRPIPRERASNHFGVRRPRPRGATGENLGRRTSCASAVHPDDAAGV